MYSLDAYKELIKHPVFSIKQVEKLVNKRTTAYSMLETLMDKGVVQKIRGKMYSPINLLTGEIIASPYQIACGIGSNSFICLRTAMAYYGIEPKPLQEILVTCDTRFRSFTFNNKLYKYITINDDFGVIKSEKEKGVSTTDLEKTFLDALSRTEIFGGLRILLDCLEQVNAFNEKTLLTYLEAFDCKTIYQKCGFILSLYKDSLGVSNELINKCKNNMTGETRYFCREAFSNGAFIQPWRMVVPKWMTDIYKFI